MKSDRFLPLLLVGCILIGGCGKKAQEDRLGGQMPPEEASLAQQAVTLPGGVAGTGQAAPDAAAIEATTPAAVTVAPPTAKDIQQALKNAGLYTAAVDGVIGPKTKKAIEEFQAQNNLKIDGKVGPKTWAVLKSFLVASSVTPEPEN